MFLVLDKTTPNARKQVGSQKTPKTTSSIKKTCQNSSEKRMDEAFQILTSAANKRQDPQKDECDLYGDLLAKKLRRYNEDEREEIMLEIDSMLLKRKKKKSVMSTPVPTPSPTYSNYIELTSSSSSQLVDMQPTMLTIDADNEEGFQNFPSITNYFQNVNTE